MISFFLSSGGERASFFIDRGTVSSLFAAIRNSFSSFFHFFIRFRFDFSSMRFFLLVDIYIQILSTILKTRQDEIKKNTSPSRFSAVSRYILDRYYIVSGSDWKSPFFRRFQRQTDRPTDRPTSRPNRFYRFRERKRYREKIRIVEQGPCHTECRSEWFLRVQRVLYARRQGTLKASRCARHVRRMRVACKFEIDIYRSTHIYIYQLSSIIVTILLRIIICTNFMLRYKINDKTTTFSSLLLSETRSKLIFGNNQTIIKRAIEATKIQACWKSPRLLSENVHIDNPSPRTSLPSRPDCTSLRISNDNDSMQNSSPSLCLYP